MLALLLTLSTVTAQTRSFYTLPAANGHAAVMADTQTAKIIHFRERMPATEEPELDAARNPIFDGNQPRIIKTRNLLFDSYFGIRTATGQKWLQNLPVASSSYENGIITWVQSVDGLTLTTYVFAPRAFAHPGFVALMHIEGTGAAAAFSLANFHLGYGRPNPGVNGETIDIGTNRDVLERAFAGVVVVRPVGPVAHALGWNPSSPVGTNGYRIVQETMNDFGDSTGTLGVADDSASGFQFSTTGTDTWVGFVVAHHGDPFAGATVQGWLDTYVAMRGPKQLLDAERAQWLQFQASVKLPVDAGLTADEEKVARQSAVMLAMAQVQESSGWLRDSLTRDGEPRRSAFATLLPADVTHKGKGAVLASLPPGEWTYAWVRDGSYAIAAMAAVGMTSQARDGVQFMLDAATLPSLTRYTGFGVPEQDYNDFGPNVEYDGYGLTLWAMRKAGVMNNPRAVEIADALLGLIEPATGLMKKDSSIWETHVMGRERTWTYTNITAVRGLCDAWKMTNDQRYRTAALKLREEIAKQLTDANGALASNKEELAAGSGYADAAVLDAFELGLFRSNGRIATATLAMLNAQLKTTAGPGWSRNDDRTDTNNLSPWGSEYDSAEWVFTDMRGSRLKATRPFTTAQAIANAGVIPETYDESTGAWKFNAPMIGFGAGAYLLSLFPPEQPACDAYYDETGGGGTDGGTKTDGGVKSDGGTNPDPGTKGCGCSSPGLGVFALLALVRRLAVRK